MTDPDPDAHVHRILLIEDNPTDAEILSLSLRRVASGRFEIVHVLTLAEASEQLRSEHFDLILTDLSLPDSFGEETFARVKQGADDTPIVVMTGFDDVNLGATLVQRGAQDYLVKSEIEGHALLRSIRHAIERKQIETDLKKAREQALAASRAKTDFLASMSHEIRTPMNSILGMADLLAETELSAEQTHFVDVFRTAGETLLELINGVLDLSKAEAGFLELDSVPFDLQELVEDALDVLALPAHRKRLVLACDIQPDLPRYLIGDPARLRQILINLIGNATKFTQKGEVVLGIERGSDSSQAATLRFSVRDTGIGIPREHQKAIFERFAQADSSTTRRFGGTGLGLSLCMQLTQLMNGHIWVESVEGSGSTFYFEIDFEIDQARAAEAEAKREELKGVALIATGSDTERRILRRLLEGLGLDVVEARRAREALGLVSRAREEDKPFDVVYLDARIPESGGFAILSELQGPDSCGEHIVMMLHADHRLGDIDECQKHGLAWLHKPIRPTRLAESTGSTEKGASDLADTPLPQTETGGLHLRILLADDSEDNRALVLAYLKKTPHKIDVAEHGAIALERFQQNIYDLVLMDMEMPVMDGYSATAAIRQWETENNRSRTPILALTAYAFAEERKRSLDAGCDAHLTKPIRKSELLAAIVSYTGAAPIVVTIDDDIKDLIDGFLENRHADLELLSKALEMQDFECLRVKGHNMKGVGRNYGFDGIGQIGSELEQAAKDSNLVEARKKVDELADYLSRVEVA